jgi:SAM-dependent methyltransferase
MLPDQRGRWIDLDRLASGYEHRPPGPDDLVRAETAADAASLGLGDVAVDVGGGKGAHAAVFAGRGAMAVVVDRSPAMAVASRRRGVTAVVGDGGRLPLRGSVARLVYFHLSIHHGDAGAMLAEAWRVAVPGGVVWVWTLTHEHHRTSLLAQWFPRIAAIDERRFPHPNRMAADMDRIGLELLPGEVREERVQRSAADWEAAVRAGFVSTLQLLTSTEIEAGLARFRAAHPDPTELLEYGLRFRSVAARKPTTRHR